MKTISVALNEITTKVLHIGLEGEQNHAQIVFDASPILNEIPNATVSLAIKPPVGNVYPKVVLKTGNMVVWVASASDCANEGSGQYQLTFINGEEIVKTFIGQFRVYNSLIGNGEAPDPIEDWIEDANAVLGEFENMTAEASTIPAGSEATAELTEEDNHKVILFGIPAGHDGKDGEDGNGIASCVLNPDYTLTINYTDGTSYTTESIRGEKGETGATGATGNGISSVVLNQNYTLTINFTDGTSYTTTSIRGEKGETGATGATGATPALTIGTVTTGEAGSSAEVTITGTAENPVLNFTIPRGDKGETGEVSEAELTAGLNGKADVITDTVSNQSIATIPDGADGLPVKELEVAVTPVQDLHGQANPYPAGGGKNLLNPHLYTGGSYNPTVGTTWELTDSNVQLTANADHSVYTITTTSTWQTYVMLVPISAGSNYKLTGSISSTNTLRSSFGYLDSEYKVIQTFNNTSASQTWDYSPSPTESDVAFYFILITNAGTASVTITLTEPQFEAGTSKTSYAPWENICPITGWTGCNVTRTGVNVWDEQWENGYYKTTDGTPASNNNYTRSKSTDYINIVPGATYYFVCGSNMDISMMWYDSEKNYISYTSKHGMAVTAPSNARYGRFYVGNSSYGGTYKNDISINYLATDTSYHSGTHNTTIPISWQSAGTVYGGTLTVNEDGTGELSVYAGHVDLGTLDWEYDSTYHRFMAILNGMRINQGARKTWMVCEAYEAICDGRAFSNVPDMSIYGGPLGTDPFVSVHDSRYTDATQFTSAVSGVYLVYELATQTTVTLSATELKTILGQNNVWADTGNILSMEYPCDTKLYVSKQIEASNRLMELIITANHEDSMKATKAYTSGNLLIVNGTLYRATTSIANGATLTVGTNVTATTIASELALLA